MKASSHESSGARPWHLNAKALVMAAAVGFILLLSPRGEAFAGDGSALVPAPRADLATPPPDDGVAPLPAPAYDGDVPAAATAPDPRVSPAAPVMGDGGSSITVTLTGSSSADSSSTMNASAPPSDEAARHSHWARVGDSEDDYSGDSSRVDAGSDQVLELPQVVDANQPPQVNAADQQSAGAGQDDGTDANAQIGSIDDYQDQVDMAGAYPVPLPMGPVIVNPMMLGSYYGAPSYGYPGGFPSPMGGITPGSVYGGALPPGPFIIRPGMNTMRSAVLSNSPMLAGSRGAFARPGGFGRAGGFGRFGGFGIGARR